MKEKTMEWVWKPFDASLGDNTSIFTHTMHHGYGGPWFMWYDERSLGRINPMVIDKNLTTFNGDLKCSLLRKYVLDESEHYLTNHISIPWGGDFWYANANLTFKNLENFITYCNEQWDNITLLYSTPSEFINAQKEQDIEWPVRYADMFPYSDRRNNYWTGFYSSRPNSKKQDR